ncbi:uncharacterized protein LOC128386169 [Panonychus citri]|uniref:uncharacterized protein LOC128386169 n=1 Tax=Panonychus citri TaxID=50023 RepID=UPI002307C572|nr:uncharacterized protein LOC128386169 [Panonychus citri]
MIKILSAINCSILFLSIILITNNQIQIVQGKPFVLSIPLITVDRIKNFFSSLTNGLSDNVVNPPSVNRLVDSCHKSFSVENNLTSSILNDEQSLDLSEPYFLYSSDNQTIIFSHVFIKVKQVNSPCPLDESICDTLPPIVSKDAPMNWIIANLLDTYWESCMAVINSVVNETNANH